MTKYIKLLGFALFSILSLSIYALTQVFAQTDSDIELVAVEGDTSYIENLYIGGFAYTGGSSMDPSFTYQDGQMTFAEDLAFLQQIDQNFSPLFNQLRQEHKSFLRGKYPYGFSEAANGSIVYAASNNEVYWSEDSNQTVTVSVLNPETAEEQNYELDFPLEDNVWFNIVDTAVNYPDLHFLVDTGTNEQTLSVYSASLEDPDFQLKKVDTLDQLISEYGTEVISDYTTFQPIKNSSRFVEITPMSSTMYEDEVITDAQYLYDYIENQLLTVPPLNGHNTSQIVVDNETIYLLEPSENQPTLHETTRNGDSLEVTSSIQIDTLGVAGSLISPFIANGYLYSYGETAQLEQSETTVQVNNLDTGELLYKGTFKVADEQDADIELMISEFSYLEN